jgi:hypothetical protein
LLRKKPRHQFLKRLLDQLAGGQIVQAVGNIDHSVRDSFVVGSSVRRVDPVALYCFSEWSKGRVLMVEELDKNML